ncbi:MAG: 3'-5' exonuclease [Opitutales bacterium]
MEPVLSSDLADLPRSITKQEINVLPLMRYEGAYELVDTDEKLESALEALKSETLLGFDTESRPSFRKGENHPVSLVQLAGATKVYLFQIRRAAQSERLREVLSDEGMVKAGVAIRDDIRKLQELFQFEEAGFVEIAELTRPLSISNTGLRSLAAIFLGFRISKNAQVSNWARKDLTRNQQVYAATDAWVSRQLYLKLEAFGLANGLRTSSQ